jgi:outer membrane translocation and assembly module TamA
MTIKIQKGSSYEISSGNVLNKSISFSPAFAGNPSVIITAYANPNALSNVSYKVYNITTNGFDCTVGHDGTDGQGITIYWIAIYVP